MASVVTGRPEPASWLPTPRALAETSTLGPGQTRDPVLPLAPGPGPSPWGHKKYPTDEADRGRHPGFARHEGVAGGPASLSLTLN
jgi:hypothetical protein